MMDHLYYTYYKHYEQNKRREAENRRMAQEVQNAKKELLPARRRRSR